MQQKRTFGCLGTAIVIAVVGVVLLVSAAMADGSALWRWILGGLALCVGVAVAAMWRFTAKDRWQGWIPPSGLTFVPEPLGLREHLMLFPRDLDPILANLVQGQVDGRDFLTFEEVDSEGLRSNLLVMPLSVDVPPCEFEQNLDLPDYSDAALMRLPVVQRYRTTNSQAIPSYVWSAADGPLLPVSNGWGGRWLWSKLVILQPNELLDFLGQQGRVLARMAGALEQAYAHNAIADTPYPGPGSALGEGESYGARPLATPWTAGPITTAVPPVPPNGTWAPGVVQAQPGDANPWDADPHSSTPPPPPGC